MCHLGWDPNSIHAWRKDQAHSPDVLRTTIFNVILDVSGSHLPFPAPSYTRTLPDSTQGTDPPFPGWVSDGILIPPTAVAGRTTCPPARLTRPTPEDASELLAF